MQLHITLIIHFGLICNCTCRNHTKLSLFSPHFFPLSQFMIFPLWKSCLRLNFTTYRLWDLLFQSLKIYTFLWTVPRVITDVSYFACVLPSQSGILLFVLERQVSDVFSSFAVFIVFKSLQKDQKVLMLP